MRWLALVLVFAPLALFAQGHREYQAPTDFGKKWAVATAHPIATQVGAEVLAQGGTAVDAAVAVSFALAVVFPEAGNIGGGTLAVGSQAASGATWMIDGRETAPLAVTYGTYITRPADASLKGPYAAGVPGTVRALEEMHRRYGKLPWKKLVAPSVKIAQDGFRLTPKGARMFGFFRKKLAADENARKQFYAAEPVTGSVLKQPELAKTLARIGASPDDFYTGQTAKLIVADAEATGGPMTAPDLAAYQAKWREPIECNYRAFRIVSSAPPSSGGVILCETAQILEHFLLQALPITGATAIHLTLEAWGQAFQDRLLLGDPDYVTAPVKKLISRSYGEQIAKRIKLDEAGLVPVPAGPQESMETTHFSVIDKDGNAVSVTTTLNGAFGNGHVVTGAGFLMNNEMDDFNTRPGQPNLYGLVQGEANMPAPGKRMLSSMSPTLVFHGEKLVLVVGTPGGSTIPTTVWQILTYLIDGGWTLDKAVAHPRFHYQGTPPAIMHEPGAFEPAVAAELQKQGYKLMERNRQYGDVHAIAWNTRRKMWMAVSDPRNDGAPRAK
jgi:gamma-glutamyltranspeptidase/glutathione hydrolase